jgi:hypothetical protein
MSELYTLGKHDVVRGAITAVFAAIIMTLNGLVTQADFNVFNADWATIVNDVVKVSAAAFMGYLLNNFFSDKDGNFAGIK